MNQLIQESHQKPTEVIRAVTQGFSRGFPLSITGFQLPPHSEMGHLARALYCWDAGRPWCFILRKQLLAP